MNGESDREDPCCGQEGRRGGGGGGQGRAAKTQLCDVDSGISRAESSDEGRVQEAPGGPTTCRGRGRARPINIHLDNFPLSWTESWMLESRCLEGWMTWHATRDEDPRREGEGEREGGARRTPGGGGGMGRRRRAQVPERPGQCRPGQGPEKRASCADKRHVRNRATLRCPIGVFDTLSLSLSLRVRGSMDGGGMAWGPGGPSGPCGSGLDMDGASHRAARAWHGMLS